MIALVVLNYNDYDTTAEFIRRVEPYGNIGRIVVVDNQSTDDSFARLTSFRSEKVDIIQSPANKGYAAGNNFGIRYALDNYGPEYIIVSNPDVEFEVSVADKLYQTAESLPDAGIVACQMVCLSGVDLASAWKLPGYGDYLIGNFPVMEKLFGSRTLYSQEYLSGGFVEVDAVSGAFFMISAKAFRAVDGFDEDTFLYGEEILLAERLHAKKFKTYFVSNEKYLHKHSASIDKSIPSLKRKLQMRQKSREIHCMKYLHTKEWQISLLWITFYIGLYERIAFSKVKSYLRKLLA